MARPPDKPPPANPDDIALAIWRRGDYDVTVSMQGFKTAAWRGVAVSGGMETVLNATLEVGKASDTLAVLASPAPVAAPRAGGGGGRGAGAALSNSQFNVTIDGVSTGALNDNSGFFTAFTPRLDAVEEGTLSSRVQNAQAALQSEATAAQLGDLFEYKLKEPVTIHKNQSALVPIAAGEVEAERVSLWTAGGRTRPLRAVWLKNTTGLTLDAGTFSVIDGQAFAGEGLMESLKPGERRLLSYAMDSGLIVDAKGAGSPTRITKVRVNRGVLINKLKTVRR
jgi:hypothetical protein